MNLSFWADLPKNQKLFLSHVFVRDFFNSLITLSWAYLLISGFPILYLVLGLLFFRISESLLGLPLSRKIIHANNYKKLFLFSLVLQGIYIFLMLFSSKYHVLFIVEMFVLALYDTIYYPIRTNLERLTVDSENLSKWVGFSQAATIAWGILGLLINPFFLTWNTNTILIIGTIGIILSYLPIHFIDHVRMDLSKSPVSFFRLFTLKKKFITFLKQPIIYLLGLLAVLGEITGIFFPILFSYNHTELTTIGFIIALFNIFSLIGAYITWNIEEHIHSKYTYHILNVLLVLSVLPFFWLDISFIGFFLILFSALSTPIKTQIYARGQHFSQKHYSWIDGGYFFEFLDMVPRVLAYPAILILIFSNKLSSFTDILLSLILIITVLVVTIDKYAWKNTPIK